MTYRATKSLCIFFLSKVAFEAPTKWTLVSDMMSVAQYSRGLPVFFLIFCSEQTSLWFFYFFLTTARRQPSGVQTSYWPDLPHDTFSSCVYERNWITSKCLWKWSLWVILVGFLTLWNWRFVLARSQILYVFIPHLSLLWSTDNLLVCSPNLQFVVVDCHFFKIRIYLWRVSLIYINGDFSKKKKEASMCCLEVFYWNATCSMNIFFYLYLGILALLWSIWYLKSNHKSPK